MFSQSYVYHVSPPAHPVLKAEKVSVCRKDQKIKCLLSEYSVSMILDLFGKQEKKEIHLTR